MILFAELRKLTRALEIYFDYIIELNNPPLKFIINKSILPQYSPFFDYILSFNYTSTFELHYAKEVLINDEKNRYVYVHGKVSTASSSTQNDSTDTKLVLGTQNFDRSKSDNIIPVEFNQFQKYNQRHKYKSNVLYQELLNKIKIYVKEPLIFYIIGHSLDKSDHYIIKNIFNVNKNSEINIFYHDESSHQNYLNKITDILGEENVDMRVIFRQQHDVNNGILIPKIND
jgi:hypothetical protein